MKWIIEYLFEDVIEVALHILSKRGGVMDIDVV